MFKAQIPTPPKVVLWRTQGCARADRALELLATARAESETYDPTQSPPSVDELRALAAQYAGAPRELALHREPLYQQLGLNNATDEALFEALAKNPSLLRLPIGVARGRAIIARPADLILGLIAPELPEGTNQRDMVRLGLSGRTPEVDASELKP